MCILFSPNLVFGGELHTPDKREGRDYCSILYHFLNIVHVGCHVSLFCTCHDIINVTHRLIFLNHSAIL
jgi:hypothetical protein